MASGSGGVDALKGLGPLARFLRDGRKRPVPGERCEFCAVPIGDEHPHVVDTEKRRLLCACRPCYLVFAPRGAARGRYRAVPTRYVELPNGLSDAQWDALKIPIELAFFFYNSSLAKVVAFYPSPGGATESELPVCVWDELTAANPLLAGLEPDVEALLIYRKGDGAQSSYVVPIDACYELVGLLRTSWKGFHGGDEAWHEIDGFFARVRARAAGRAATPHRVS